MTASGVSARGAHRRRRPGLNLARWAPAAELKPRWPGLQLRTIRARIYATLIAIILLTLAVAGLALFLVLGGYQDEVDRSRVRELATAWGPELFSQEREARTFERLLSIFETDLRVSGSIVAELDVVVLGLSASGEVVRISEREDRFLGEQLAIELGALADAAQDGTTYVEGAVEAEGGERLTYVLARLSEEEAARQGYCCVAVALVGEPRAALLGDLSSRLVIAGVLALVIATLVGFLVSRSIYRPVQRVAAAARSVARGQLQQRVAVEGSQEAQELAQSFNQMTEEVERQQTALRDFLANVSHDLQTPLTSINGFSRALMDNVVEEQEGRQNAYRIIEDESRRLLRLVGGLVDLSRIEAGQVQVERKPVDAATLLSHVGDLFTLRAQELDVRLSVAESDVGDVLGDWDRLDQVLGNLVDNALRHTPPGGDVVLSARVESETSVSIAVADTGVGIAEEAIPHLFDRYYKSDRPGAQGGTGLGLAIARELVRAQGGEIQVSSEQGEGTTFRVILRRADEAESSQSDSAEPSADASARA